MARSPTCLCRPDLKDGVPFSSFIRDVFHDCVYDSSDYISFLMGLASIAFYMICMFPQLRDNYRARSVQGLSVGFVIIWICGDICNVTGCILGHQLPTQLITGVYFIAIDACLLVQWIWYTHVSPAVGAHEPRPKAPEQDRLLPSQEVSMLMAVVPGLMLAYNFWPAASVISPLARTLLAPIIPDCLGEADVSELQLVLGGIASWLSGLLYFFSRMPQVYRNWFRKSVQGLSMTMFICTMTANLSYGVSILLRFPDTSVAKFPRDTLPFLIGSVGTIVFDFIILCQFRRYHGQRQRARC